jgi:hypothetical protein
MWLSVLLYRELPFPTYRQAHALNLAWVKAGKRKARKG